MKSSSRGSISGGSEWALYPRIASGLTITGAILELVDVEVEAGAGSLKRDEADGAFFINAANASNSEDEASGVGFDDVEGAFDSREVVDSDLSEEVSPLKDVLSDMVVCIGMLQLDRPSSTEKSFSYFFPTVFSEKLRMTDFWSMLSVIHTYT